MILFEVYLSKGKELTTVKPIDRVLISSWDTEGYVLPHNEAHLV